jgi:hypothetical protein
MVITQWQIKTEREIDELMNRLGTRTLYCEVCKQKTYHHHFNNDKLAELTQGALK